jgi:CRISPR-associated endoribonuclease Cas6
MRFRIALFVDKKAFGNRLPLSYQYELSSFVYRAIACADTGYASWLHENGFNLNGKMFKLFTFSNLIVSQYGIEKEQGLLRIDSDRVEWQISFLPEKSTEKFVHGLFSEQEFQIGDKKSVVQFKVERIEMLPPPQFEPEMSFRTLSPVCISIRQETRKYPLYISPEDPEASNFILNNLLNKYLAFYGKPYEGNIDFDFRVTSQPKAKLITIKIGTEQESNIRGFLFDFRIKAPEELMRIMYESGLGEKNSIGFGMIGIKK